MNARGDPIEILLVEDNPGDVALTERALTSAEIPNRLSVAAYGADALTHLRNVPDGAAGRPHLILLDLHLPDMSGFDVLAFLKADSRLRRIPVVVITSSDTEADVVRSYELQACGYVTKPLDPTDFVGGVGNYWHRIARLPPI